MRARVSRC